MNTKRIFTLVAILVIASLLGACAPSATAKPVVIGDGNTTNVTNNITTIEVNVDGNNNQLQIGDNTLTSSEEEVDNSIAIAGAAATEAPATTAEAPEAAAVETDWLIFGRNDDDGKYFMGIAGINPELLLEGTPLQQYHSQLTDSSYSGLTLSAKLEDLNDGLKYVIKGDKVFKVPTTGNVAIDSVSWVRYIEGIGLLICRDDSGTAGTWYGNCADATATVVADWVSLESFMASGEFQPWAAQFTSVSESFDGITNGKIEVFVTYR